MHSIVFNLPASGTAAHWSTGFMPERDSNETSELNIPGKWIPAAWTMKPVAASIAHRPFFSSPAWNHANVSELPRLAKPSGSKFFKGAVLPATSSRLTWATVREAYKVEHIMGELQTYDDARQTWRFVIHRRRTASLTISSHLLLRSRGEGSGRAGKSKNGSDLHGD